jgi:hypothetical protein
MYKKDKKMREFEERLYNLDRVIFLGCENHFHIVTLDPEHFPYNLSHFHIFTKANSHLK